MSDDRIRTLTESLVGVVTSLGAAGSRPDDVNIKEDHELVLELMHLLGYENAGRIVRKELTGNYLEQDGSATGETFVINGTSGLALLSVDGEDLHLATKWLNSIWHSILGNKEDPGLCQKVQGIMEKSKPLTPIVLTEFGERIREYPVSGDIAFPKHTRDSNELDSTPGVHDLCDGWIDLRQVSKGFNALICRRCHLRVLVPVDIKTYGKLRLYFEHFQVK